MPATPFTGFPLGLLHFLEELTRHNNKKWFDSNRERYERELREPALAFIAAMEKPLKKISPHFMAVPKKVGGSLMRIHRDTRFSKDKTPYKTNVGIQFRHELGKDVHAPGFYFHIDTEQVFLGAGMWHPESVALADIRQTIDEYPRDWRKARDAKPFRAQFDLAGDSLKRPPRGYAQEHPLIVDLKRKDHIAIANLDHDLLFDASLIRTVCDAFKTTRPYVRFLCEAIGVDF
ncbi:MAG: DUF2461 domain-containing protein [Aeoliella sp.]